MQIMQLCVIWCIYNKLIGLHRRIAVGKIVFLDVHFKQCKWQLSWLFGDAKTIVPVPIVLFLLFCCKGIFSFYRCLKCVVVFQPMHLGWFAREWLKLVFFCQYTVIYHFKIGFVWCIVIHFDEVLLRRCILVGYNWSGITRCSLLKVLYVM